MPTYDYKCSDCGHKFEFFQSMKDEHLKDCPECGGNVKRLIGAGLGPIFKGKGFYETDYKKKSSSETKKTNSVKSKTNSAKTNNQKSEKK